MFGTWTRDKNRPLRRIWDATTPAVMAEQDIIANLEEADVPLINSKKRPEEGRHPYRFHLFNRQSNTSRTDSTRNQQEDTNEEPCTYVDERYRSALLGLWKPSEDHEAPKFFKLFPLRQLFIPRIPYPLWDIHWDTAERSFQQKEQGGVGSISRSMDTSSHSNNSTASKTKSERLVTRHIFLVRHGQYENPNCGECKEEDLVLTKLGRAQSRLTGQRLATFIAQNDAKHGPCTVKLLCTSELTRAKQTADIIQRELHAMHLKHGGRGSMAGGGNDDDEYVVDRCEPDPLLNEGVPCHHIPAENIEANQLDKLVEAIDVDHPRIEQAFQKYIARSQWLEEKSQLAMAFRAAGGGRRTAKRRNSDGGSSVLQASYTVHPLVLASAATNARDATDVTTNKPIQSNHRSQSEFNLQSLSKDFDDEEDDASSGHRGSTYLSQDINDLKKSPITATSVKKPNTPPEPASDACTGPDGRPGLQSMRSQHHLYNTIGNNIAKWMAASGSVGTSSERGNNNNLPNDNKPTRHHEYEIIVTHANVIRYFLCRAWQVPPEAWLRFEILNGSITYMIVKGYGSAMCQMVGDTGHLPYSKISGDSNDGFSWEDKPVIKRTLSKTPNVRDSATSSLQRV
jgi:broad specificity phosphatase PhoE